MFHTNVRLILAIGGLLLCLLFVPHITAAAIGQVEGLHIKDTEKTRIQNPSLLPMERLQIEKNDKNMSLFKVDKKLNVLPMGSLQTAKTQNEPNENPDIVKSTSGDNENNNNNNNMKTSGNRLLPQGYKFNSQSSRTVDNRPFDSHRKKPKLNFFPNFDRAKSPQINIDYYRPLSAYEETSDLPPNVIKNLRNSYATLEFDDDKDNNDQYEITLPMFDDHNDERAKTDEAFKIQARANNYYPNKENLNTVCMGKSTVYNKPRVVQWLKRAMYRYFSVDDESGDVHIDRDQERHRPIWFDLRYQLFKDGRSEECHIETSESWRPYSECALRRNQRMEYMIPKYPLHQRGYIFRWTTQINERPYNIYRSYMPRTDNWCLENSCY